MCNSRQFRVFFLSVLLCLSVGALWFFPWVHELAEQEWSSAVAEPRPKLSSSLSLISENDLHSWTQVSDLDLTLLEFDGEPGALDRESSTLYMPQSADNLTSLDTLTGTLTAVDTRYSLYLLEETVPDDLPAAVESGVPLTLIVQCGSVYQKVSLIITTLPVMRMEGSVIWYDEEDWDIYYGEVVVWSDDGQSEPVSASAQWHVRGGTTRWREKTPWKLSLKNRHGDNLSQELLGMGSDDDWILNSMVHDDTKIREKLAMDLWNSYAAQEPWNFPMSTGEYVELVLNGEYHGLYLLQRRVDEKYLQLHKDEDILMKGVSTETVDELEDGYETIFTPYSQEATFQILEQTLERQRANQLDTSNIVDVNLFLNYLYAPDNAGYKNMFYLLVPDSSDYQMYYVPWDTDMSLGILWEDGFVYNYDRALESYVVHQDFSNLLITNSWLAQQTASRWKELRQSMYSKQAIEGLFEEIYGQLHQCNAVQRDQERWGTWAGGEDTYAKLRQFCIERLEVLDQYYE